MEKINGIKVAGKIVASILRQLKKAAQVGVSGRDLEKIAQNLMTENKAQSSSLGYQIKDKVFPSSICVSVNNELTHGIPDERPFQDGDLVSFDVACHYQGYHADAALTVIVGAGDEEKKKLLRVTKNSLYHAIQSIKPNITTTQDIGTTLEKYIRSRGYYPIKEYGGHGIGQSLHEEPFIPNYKTANKGTIIKTGMVICIEPLVQVDDGKVAVAPNQ